MTQPIGEQGVGITLQTIQVSIHQIQNDLLVMSLITASSQVLWIAFQPFPDRIDLHFEMKL